MTGFLGMRGLYDWGDYWPMRCTVAPNTLACIAVQVLFASACCHLEVNTNDAEGRLTLPDGL